MGHAPQRRLDVLPDGTVRQLSPISGTVVWTVPSRARRPLRATLPAGRPIDRVGPERACAFCAGRYRDTPPEKARLVLDPDRAGDPPWRVHRSLPAEQLELTVADFRWFPNLFQILPLEYWQANHGLTVPTELAARAQQYAATPAGRDHLIGVLRARARAGGPGADQVRAADDEALLAHAVTLFTSTHDVVVARRHFVDHATDDDELCACGDLTPDEHHAFLAFTVDALRDLATANPFVRYVATFQNWLSPAGASFDHLHKQLVAIDEHGPLMSRIVRTLADHPDLFNAYVADPASRDGLVIAENDHAVALAGVGHRYPTIEVYSTSPRNLPWDHDPAALRGMSDLLHACHAATGRLVPSNEEWHYRPRDVGVAMPWRINLKWRVSTLAGFEGGTKINVNTISPFALREQVVTELGRLRSEQRIAALRVGHECPARSGALRYRDG